MRDIQMTRPSQPAQRTRSGLLGSGLSLLLLLNGFTAMASAADPQTLSLERIFASPDLAGPSLRDLQVSPSGDRVTFLRGKEQQRDQLDLWEYHVASGELRLLVDSQQLVPSAGELSEEEKNRRERQRLGGLNGIVEYHWSEDGQFLLFPLDGDVYLYRLQGDANQRVQQVTASEAFETDPQISPDGRHVAFIRDQNLFVTDLAKASERALTSDGGGLIKNGVAEFIAQEEMGRFSGYWWSPDSQSIAFLRVDDSPVPVTKRYEIEANDIRIIEQRYPYAGANNAQLKLGIVSVASGKTRWVDLGAETDIYIPRVKWLPSGQQLSFQRQSRDQQSLELLLVDLNAGDAGLLQPRLLIEDQSDTWVELHDDLRFLKQEPALLWSSAHSGYQHLYLYDLEGQLLRPLTQGNWQVDKVQALDEEQGWVYFTATYDSATESQLYRQSLKPEDPGKIQRLTQGAGFHDVVMDRTGQVFVDHYSNRDQPPQTALYDNTGKRLTWLIENALDADHPYTPFVQAHQPTEFGEIPAVDGQPLYYRLTKPLGFNPKQRYPVFYHVYGGPTAQTVTNRWDRRILFEQYMAQQGFVVFSLDNRGTPRRGTAFQQPAYHNLGVVEVEDQHRGVEYLRSLPYVDGSRIGIFGWSYGGYLTLMSVLKDSESYALGVAGAPVTDWALYDTHYTERYLGRPQDQAEAYARANVLNVATQLKSRLLVIHGMADDNVLFSHTTQLYRVLQDAGILFETMPYPGAKHGASGQATQTHVYKTIADFFVRNLNPPQATSTAR